MKRPNLTVIVLAAILLVLMTAGASALITSQALKAPDAASIEPASGAAAPARVHTVIRDRVRWIQPAPAPAPVQQACDDGNIAGKVLGGVVGGAAGSELGKGKGQTAATIGGTLGGAYLGGQFGPTRNVTCR